MNVLEKRTANLNYRIYIFYLNLCLFKPSSLYFTTTMSLLRSTIAQGTKLVAASGTSARVAFANQAIRAFSSSNSTNKPAQITPEGLTDLKSLPRQTPTSALHADIVNPADKYTEHVENLHKYGKYLMSALPKFIQSFLFGRTSLLFSFPTAVIPVMTF